MDTVETGKVDAKGRMSFYPGIGICTHKTIRRH